MDDFAGCLLDGKHERRHIKSGLLGAVLSSRKNGLGRIGCARERIDAERLVLNDLLGNDAKRRVGNTDGFLVFTYLKRGNFAGGIDRHRHGHRAVVALCRCRVRTRLGCKSAPR